VLLGSSPSEKKNAQSESNGEEEGDEVWDPYGDDECSSNVGGSSMNLETRHKIIERKWTDAPKRAKE